MSDLISREALKKALNFVYDCAYIDSKSKEGIVSDIIDEIDNAPSVMSERPKGEWIKIGEIGLAYKCNKCGEVNVIPTNFCPNCGAKMKGGAE